MLPVDGIVKCKGPFSKFLVNKVFWMFQCQMSQPLLHRQVSFYAISFCMILLWNGLKMYTTFCIYLIIFSLTRFGIDNPWAHLSSVGGLQKVLSLSCHQSCEWMDYVFENVCWFEVCSTEIHLDTRITKCSQFTILHELCLVLRVIWRGLSC